MFFRALNDGIWPTNKRSLILIISLITNPIDRGNDLEGGSKEIRCHKVSNSQHTLIYVYITIRTTTKLFPWN